MALLDNNGVPILSLGDTSQELVDEKHQSYLESGDESYLYTGELVYLDNPQPIALDHPDVTVFHIGGETLDEAIKTVIGTFDGFYGRVPPNWVTSTNDELAHLIAEHYDAEVRPVVEEVTL